MRQEGARDAVQMLGPALGRLELDKLRLKADRFEDLLNSRLLPWVGLHGAALGGVIVAQDRPEIAGYLGALFAIVAGATLLHGVWSRETETGCLRTGSGAASAILALVGLCMLSPGIVQAAGIVCVMWALTLAVSLDAVRAKETIAPPLYVAVVCIAAWYGGRDYSGAPALVLAVIFAGFMPAIVVLFARNESRYSVGLFLGAALLLLTLMEDDGAMLVAAIVALLAILAAAVRYDFTNRPSGQSALRAFLGQVPAMALLSVLAALLGFDVREWALLLAGFQFLMMLVPAGNVGDVRMTWAALAVMFALLQEFEPGSPDPTDSWNVLLASLVGPLSLLIIGWGYSSYFALTIGRLAVGLVGWLLLHHLDSFAVPEKGSFAFLLPGSLTLSAIVATALLLVPQPGAGPVPAWWRGLLRPRHVVLVRRGWRVSAEQIRSIPLLNGFVAVGRGLLILLRFVRGGREWLWLSDIVAVGWPVFGAIASIEMLDLSLRLAGDAESGGAAGISFLAALEDVALLDWVSIFAWLVWGSMALLVGLAFRHLLLLLTGGALLLVPVLQDIPYFGDMEADEIGLLVFLSGILLFLWGTVLGRLVTAARNSVVSSLERRTVSAADALTPASADST